MHSVPTLNNFRGAILLAALIVAPTGNLFNFYGPIGLSTLLFLIFAMVTVFDVKNWHLLVRSKIFLFSIFFGIYLGAIELLSSESFLVFNEGFRLIIYALIGFGVFTHIVCGGNGLRLVVCFSCSVALISLVSLLDKYDFIAIAGFNEISRSIYHDSAFLLDNSFSLSGPFRSRTEFVTYISLTLPFALVLSFSKTLSRRTRAVLLVCSMVMVIAAISAGSRGLYLGWLGASLFFLLASFRSQKIKRVFVLFATLCLFGVSLYIFDSELVTRLVAQIATINPGDVREHSSDNMRFLIWQAAIEQFIANPFGYGFSGIQLGFGYYVNAHNLFFGMLHAGGILGVVFLYFLVSDWVRLAKVRKASLMTLGLLAGLLSFYIYNLTHTQWAANLFWVILGLSSAVQYMQRIKAFSISKESNYKQQATPDGFSAARGRFVR